MTTTADFGNAAREYERVVRLLSQMQDESFSPPAKAWNRLFDKLDKPGRVLRNSVEGRRFISGLMDDPSSTVRSFAASSAIFWDEDRARSTLQEIRDGDYGLQSVTAEYTLREFDKGGLRDLRPDKGIDEAPQT